MGGLIVQMGTARWNITKRKDRVNRLVTEHNVSVTPISLNMPPFQLWSEDKM
jgi:hypothetical protein